MSVRDVWPLCSVGRPRLGRESLELGQARAAIRAALERILHAGERGLRGACRGREARSRAGSPQRRSTCRRRDRAARTRAAPAPSASTAPRAAPRRRVRQRSHSRSHASAAVSPDRRTATQPVVSRRARAGRCRASHRRSGRPRRDRDRRRRRRASSSAASAGCRRRGTEQHARPLAADQRDARERKATRAARATRRAARARRRRDA